jgi:hypothetical protein
MSNKPAPTSIAKNRREQVVVQLRKWKGCDLLDVRVFVPDLMGQPRATKDGISVRVRVLPEIAAALKAAEAEARRLGLLPPEEATP